LYDVEERGKTLDAAARLRVAAGATPADLESHATLAGRRYREAALPAAGSAKHWAIYGPVVGMTGVSCDPRIRSTMPSEQIIRPLTVGRNNWQFLGIQASNGSSATVQRRQHAHRHHLMIDDYLEDVLRKLADAQQNILRISTCLAVPGRSSAGSLGLGASPICATRAC